MSKKISTLVTVTHGLDGVSMSVAHFEQEGNGRPELLRRGSFPVKSAKDGELVTEFLEARNGATAKPYIRKGYTDFSYMFNDVHLEPGFFNVLPIKPEYA